MQTFLDFASSVLNLPALNLDSKKLVAIWFERRLRVDRSCDKVGNVVVDGGAQRHKSINEINGINKINRMARSCCNSTADFAAVAAADTDKIAD